MRRASIAWTTSLVRDVLFNVMILSGEGYTSIHSYRYRAMPCTWTTPQEPAQAQGSCFSFHPGVNVRGTVREGVLAVKGPASQMCTNVPACVYHDVRAQPYLISCASKTTPLSVT